PHTLHAAHNVMLLAARISPSLMDSARHRRFSPKGSTARKEYPPLAGFRRPSRFVAARRGMPPLTAGSSLALASRARRR
ncbi:hypothetical protein Dimus_003898, partial [Dionaea muscipula]